MPSESALSRTSEKEARLAKARHSSSVMSNRSPSPTRKFEDLRHGLAVRLQAGFRLPDLGVPGLDRVEQPRRPRYAPGVVADPGVLLDERHEPDAREPGGRLPRTPRRTPRTAGGLGSRRGPGRGATSGSPGSRPGSSAGRVGRPEDERLVPLVGAVVEERGRLGIGPGDDDARHAHDVELEARRVEPLVLLVLADQDLAGLVAALLGARLLVLDVIARDADLDESPDQVPNVRVTAVAGVGVGDDERAEVDGRCRPPLPSSIWARAKCWFLSAVRSARTRPAASSGTWLSG